jgi:hypothetical protein
MAKKLLINDDYDMTEELISIDLLQTTDSPYHLASDEQDVRYIAERWIDKKCEALYISYRDGIYRVIEGQKRTLAAKMRFVTGKKLKCMVRRDLKTVEEEARWFYELNHQKRKFNETTEGFLSRQYFDETWKSIVSYVKDAGLDVTYFSNKSDNYISCLTTLETVYEEFHEKASDDEFKSMLDLLHTSCIGASESLMANFLKGFAVFYRAYSYDIDVKTLKKCFVKEDKKTKTSLINLDSYKLIQENTKKFKDDYSKIGKPVAVSIRLIYNKAVRNKDKQLKLSSIEDLDTTL